MTYSQYYIICTVIHAQPVLVYLRNRSKFSACWSEACKIKSQFDTYVYTLAQAQNISPFLPLDLVGYQCRQLAFAVLPLVSASAPPDVVAGFHLLFGSLLLMLGVVWRSAHPQRGPPSCHHPTLNHPTLLRYQTFWQQSPSL